MTKEKRFTGQNTTDNKEGIFSGDLLKYILHGWENKIPNSKCSPHYNVVVYWIESVKDFKCKIFTSATHFYWSVFPPFDTRAEKIELQKIGNIFDTPEIIQQIK